MSRLLPSRLGDRYQYEPVSGRGRARVPFNTAEQLWYLHISAMEVLKVAPTLGPHVLLDDEDEGGEYIGHPACALWGKHVAVARQLDQQHAIIGSRADDIEEVRNGG